LTNKKDFQHATCMLKVLHT